jgi:hypothetical protein
LVQVEQLLRLQTLLAIKVQIQPAQPLHHPAAAVVRLTTHRVETQMAVRAVELTKRPDMELEMPVDILPWKVMPEMVHLIWMPQAEAVDRQQLVELVDRQMVERAEQARQILIQVLQSPMPQAAAVELLQQPEQADQALAAMERNQIQQSQQPEQ